MAFCQQSEPGAMCVKAKDVLSCGSGLLIVSGFGGKPGFP